MAYRCTKERNSGLGHRSRRLTRWPYGRLMAAEASGSSLAGVLKTAPLELPSNLRYSGDAMARLRLDGLTLAYDIAGQGIPLVFIHQGGTDRRLWQEQRALLAGQYLMMTVDVLGHGELRWPLEAVSIRRAAVYVQRLLKTTADRGGFSYGCVHGGRRRHAARSARSLLSSRLPYRRRWLSSPVQKPVGW